MCRMTGTNVGCAGAGDAWARACTYFLRCLWMLALASVACSAIAYPGGITGRTKKDGGAGCQACHSVSMSETLTVSISGPAELAAGEQGTYTVNISSAAASKKAGVNIAASSDNLSESSIYLQKPDDDLTHNSTDDKITDSNGEATFTFKFTMPAGAGVGATRTLYATARAGGKWGHDNNNFTITVPKLTQSITFNAQTSPRTYSNGGTFPISPLASASSGLSISYSTADSNICTVVGTTIHMQGAGQCAIRANQGGDPTYDPAPQVTRSVMINPGNQSITFGSQNYSPMYAVGGTFNLNPAASATSGRPIQYSSTTTGVCTKAASGIVVNMQAKGTCTIVASEPGNVDWNPAAPVQRNIVIAKGNQTITFPAQSNKAFIANGSFSVSGVSASSNLAVTYVSLTPDVCTTPGTTSSTVTMLDNGTCTIEASQSGDNNFYPAPDVTGDILLTETPVSPLFGQNYSGDARTTITFGRNGNSLNSTTYVATCSSLGQTMRSGSSTTSLSPIVVTGLVNGVNYTCSLKATNSFGESASVNAGTATPATTPLDDPVFRSSASLPSSLFTFNVGTAKNFTVVTTGRGNATISGSGSLPSGMTFQTTATNPKVAAGLGLLGGTPAAGTVGSYSYNVTATNTSCGGTLEPVCPVQTVTFTVSKGNPTITFPVVADRPYSPTPNYNLAATIATSHSTLAATNIVFTSASPTICAVSGTQLTTLTVGACTINANSSTAAGYTASYNAAPQVSRTFNIVPASQTITFNAQSTPTRPYVPGFVFGLNPLASASSSQPVTYASLTLGVCTITGTTITMVGAGTCTIEASQNGNALYLPAPDVTQDIVITKASQTITFGTQGAQSFVQGGSFALSPVATASSGLPIDYISSTPGVCLSQGTSVSIVSVGVCTIVAMQPGDNNYQPASNVNRNIVINAVVPGAPVLNDTLANDATIRLYFDPPNNTGGAAISGYRGTCNPGNVTASATDSPVVVGGLANNTTYTCTVSAQNSAGFGAESSALMATPILRSGSVLWTGVCSGCHGSTPNAGRFNAAGDTGVVIAYVRSEQPDMRGDPLVQALTANELSEIAKYIKTFVPAINVSTNYVTPTMIDVGLPNHLYLGGVAFTDAVVVTPPANGTLSVFNGTVITYTPNPGFAGADSFTYRGRRTSPQLVEGEARTVNITVNTPSAPVITSGNAANGVFNQAFSYQITATNAPASFGASGLPPGVTVNTGNGLVSGTPTAAGTFNAMVSATNPGGTGQLAVTITISAANQTITFGAQGGQSFAPGGMFTINPLATATSGLTVTYASQTPGVCSVSGSTVTMLTAGTCTIEGNQGGNANYNAALPVTRNVAISPTVPGAPVIDTATPGNTSATIAFSAPANNGGSPITQYNATCTPSGSGNNTVSPITIGSLANNTQYTCRVTATNAAGTSAQSDPVLVTPQSTPVPPQFTSANATSFTVLTPGTFNVTASGTPAPTLSLQSGALPGGVSFVNGLLSGTPASGAAAGSPYNLVFFADGTNPDATQNFTLTVAKQNQTITFNNPGAQSFSQVTIPLTASASSGLTVTLASNTPSVCTVSGFNLTTLTTGVCSITASQAGNADVNAANSVTNAFSINAASQSITFGPQVSPRNYSSSPFALSPVAFATSGLVISYSTTTPSVCVMSGNNVNTLTAGTCTIAANQAGNANYAAAPQVTQSVLVNAIAPGAPTIGTATGSDMQASIAFTAPSSSGGSPITSYTATCTPSGSASGSASPVVVGGLTNGQSYTCSVTATNQAGLTGAASGSVNVTPTSANGSAIWTSVCAACHGQAPSGNQFNGAGSTATVLQHVRSTQTLMANWAPVQNLTASDLAAVATFIRDQLPANTPSTPQNTAVPVNVNGHVTFTNQTWSAFTSVEVVAPPANGMLSAFTGTAATYTPNNGFSGMDSFTYRGKRSAPDVTGDPIQVTIAVLPGAPSITSPLTANGTFNAPFSYQIAATGSPTWFGASGLPAGLSINASGLISGTPAAAGMFAVTISATNAGGTTNANLDITVAQAAQSITFPAQTVGSRSFVQGGSFVVNPVATGGVSGQPVTYGSSTAGVCTVSGTTVNMVASGICTITANQAGNANYLAAPQVMQSVTINAVAPSAPTIGTATPGNMTAAIAFSAPSNNGGAPITSYQVSCTPSGSASGPASPVVVSALTNGVTYACTVTATNAAALTSAPSQPVNVTPQLLTVPDAPVIGIPTDLNAAASIAFTPPANNGGSPVTGYTATCNPGMFSNSGAAPPIVVSGLTNGVTYACSVIATNGIGSSVPSATTDVTPFAPITLDKVVSRKLHGVVVGEVTLNTAPVTGAIAVEPRLVGNGHQIVFVFTGDLGGNPGTVSITDALGMPYASISANVVASGSEAVVTLGNVPEITRLTVSLTNVAGSGIDVSASLGFLPGDISGSQVVTAADIAGIKSRSGFPVSGTNFLYDLNVSGGTINAVDVSVAKSRAGIRLP